MTDEKEILRYLNYSPKWVDNGLLDSRMLIDQYNEFITSDDKNTEHYRYKTFTKFLRARPTLDKKKLNDIFDLIKSDPDESLGRAMAVDILKLHTLTPEEFNFFAKLVLEHFGQNMQKYINKQLDNRKT